MRNCHIYNKVWAVLVLLVTTCFIPAACTIEDDSTEGNYASSDMSMSGKEFGIYAGFWSIDQRNVGATTLTVTDMSMSFTSFPCDEILRFALGEGHEISPTVTCTYGTGYVQNGYSSNSYYYMVDSGTCRFNAMIDGSLAEVKAIMSNAAEDFSLAFYSDDTFTVILKIKEVKVNEDTAAIFDTPVTLTFNTTNRIK